MDKGAESVIKYGSIMALVIALMGCSSGEKEVPKENVFTPETQVLDKAKESAATVEQAAQTQAQQIEQQMGDSSQNSQQ